MSCICKNCVNGLYCKHNDGKRKECIPEKENVNKNTADLHFKEFSYIKKEKNNG